MSGPTQMTDEQRESITGEMSRISIFTFFSVAEQLGLDEDEQRRFLEDPDEDEFADWRDHGAGVFSPGLFLKVNALVSLSAAINQRFEFEQARRWLRTPNAAPVFEGRTPVQAIAEADYGMLERIQAAVEEGAS
jgi:hypothetical protein